MLLLPAVVLAQDQPQKAPLAFAFSGGNSVAAPQDDDWTQRIIERTNLEHQAHQFFRLGRFDDAVEKYKKALHPRLIHYDHDKSTAIGGIVQVLKVQGKYEESLEWYRWFVDRNEEVKSRFQPGDFEDESEITGIISARQVVPAEWHEIKALIQARDSSSSQAICNHISYLKKRYKRFIPPRNYSVGFDNIIADIIRLYDYIGDYDAGIEFVDGVLNYFKKKGYLKDVTPTTSAYDYFRIREAFLEDKAENRPSCVSAKPATNDSEVCMGRATKVIIQSDYFPW